MNLDKAITLIKQCAERMTQLYGREVFDEWAIVAIEKNVPRILFYMGPSETEFTANLTGQHMFHELQTSDLNFGDFAFAYDGFGPKADGFLVLGRGIYLVCNNTQRAITQITNNPLWRSAQIPFVDLAEAFKADPLVD